ncbi:MAG: response regulator [Magnetococcales bacterium]|nr:response regulator [Magnetococcales bacterium]
MREREGRILIVDDEKSNLDVMTGLLREQYKTVVAKNGEQALQRAAADPQPDLILLDVMMPGMDGFEVCGRLKENPATRHIPVIFVTALDQIGDEAAGFAMGAVDYIFKPINPAILRVRLRTHLALADQSRLLEQQVLERTQALEQAQETLRATMGNLLTIQVGPGVFWLQIPEAGLYVLCGCPAEVVKLLMLKGLNAPAIKNGVNFETGPNVILLSDLLVQNGGFSNMAEFPVLQMLYRQGMIIPGHPNNTGVKPMLMGAADQVRSQLAYIHRGNYGLSREELLQSGMDEETTDWMMRIKLQFAFGKIREPSEFLDTLIVNDQPQEIRNGACVQRIGFNRFRFTFRGQSAEVDLNLPKDMVYKSPYPLGYHRVQRHYFAVLHTGEGDGWDSERPSMSSVLMFQGRYYLIDAIPGVLNVLSALGIDISEVEGIFQTHAHDDHFGGLPALIQTDRRLKYYATPMVRSSVAKKFAALMSFEEQKFEQFFEIHDLEFDVWNQLGGLEVRPIYSPHPVETSLLVFRALADDGYRSYGHWTDLTSFAVLDRMAAPGPFAISAESVQRIKDNYHFRTDLKKLDIGGGMIHGMAQDFRGDPSKRLMLAHLARGLTTEEMEIGSESTFGALDILIPGEQDYRRQRSFNYLRELFPETSDDNIRMLINGPIVQYNAGSFIRWEGDQNDFVEMTVSGDVVYLDADFGILYHLGFGSFMGLQLIFPKVATDEGSYRAISHSAALRIPVRLFRIFLENSGLYAKLVNILGKIRFLRHTWLFGEQTSFVFLARIAQSLETIAMAEGEQIELDTVTPALWMVVKGRVAMVTPGGRIQEMIAPGAFFGEWGYLNQRPCDCCFRVEEAGELLRLNWSGLLDAPIIHWKMLEISQKRARLSHSSLID